MVDRPDKDPYPNITKPSVYDTHIMRQYDALKYNPLHEYVKGTEAIPLKEPNMPQPTTDENHWKMVATRYEMALEAIVSVCKGSSATTDTIISIAAGAMGTSKPKEK